MIKRFFPGDAAALPAPERGRSARVAHRVGGNDASRFDRADIKTARARHLRRNSTDVETMLWHKLRNGQLDGAGFRRQHPAGRYIPDFYRAALQLAIELDGGQHDETQQAARDGRRDAWLADRGVAVLRFWNSDVTENLGCVVEVIAAKVAGLRTAGLSPIRRWRADLPLSGGGSERKGRV